MRIGGHGAIRKKELDELKQRNTALAACDKTTTVFLALATVCCRPDRLPGDLQGLGRAGISAWISASALPTNHHQLGDTTGYRQDERGPVWC
jgi:hypothetical protein